MNTAYRKIPFERVKDSIEQIFQCSKANRWELVPDQVQGLADAAGVKLEWTPIEGWTDFEYGRLVHENSSLLNSIFKEIKPSGQIIIVTDECFNGHEAYQVVTHDLEDFISKVYPKIHGMDFFQPMDYLFICPDIKMIAILHHEGQVTQYEANN